MTPARASFVLFLVLAVFVGDCLTPQGYAVWLGYLLPQFLCGWWVPSRFAFVPTLFFTLATAVAWFVAPHLGDPGRAAVNRALGVGAFWMVTLLIRRQARTLDSLARNEERYRSLLEDAPDAIWVGDPSTGRIVEVNRAAEALYQASREELLAASPASLVAPIQPGGLPREKVLAGFLASVGSRQRVVSEVLCQTLRGEPFPAEGRAVLVPVLGRNVVRVTVIDLREKRRTEELARRAAALEEENRVVLAASTAKSEFVANMSHELRTPLNAILGFTELIREGKAGTVNAKQREYLGDVLTSGRHLLALLNEILDAARAEAGTMAMHPAPMALEPAVLEVGDVLRPLADRAGLELACEVSPGLGEAVLDPLRVKQLLYNFGANAIKFTPRGGRVVLRALPLGEDAVRFEVIDSGAGIAAADQGRLFQRFSQLEPLPGKGREGTGLGLALSRFIAEAHGGTVGVESAPGKGSLFWARLPRTWSVPPPPAGGAR